MKRIQDNNVEVDLLTGETEKGRLNLPKERLEYKSDEEKNEFFNSFIYRVVLFDDYIYIFYNTSPEYPTKVKLEKEELNALRELSHPEAEKDAENKESTPFEPLKFKLGACAARGQKASFCRKLRGVKTKRSNLYPTIQKSKSTKNHATADTANS